MSTPCTSQEAPTTAPRPTPELTATAMGTPQPSLKPIVTTCIPRYDRRINIDSDSPKGAISRRLESTHWKRCAHPEGAMYFFRQEHRVYTESNLDDEDVLTKIERYIALLCSNLNKDNQDESPSGSVDLVLELNDEASQCHYYFADNKRRTLFWTKAYQSVRSEEPEDLQGAKSESHKKLKLERLYWCISCRLHVSYFPHGHEDAKSLGGKNILKELKAKLAWYMTEDLSSPFGLAPWTTEELQRAIQIVDYVEGLDQDQYEYTLAVAGDLLSTIALAHYEHYHGEYGARLSSNQSVRGAGNEPKIGRFRFTLFLLLLNAPRRYLMDLYDNYTDDVVRRVTLKKHLADLRKDWHESVLYATIVLNANVAYLAIPNMTPENAHQSSAGRVASLISMIMSLGSAVTGLILTWKHGDEPSEIREATKQLLMPDRNIYRLAVVYSIPYALLLWAVISFTVAVSFTCFNGDNLVTVVLSTVVLSLVLWLTLWCAISEMHTIRNCWRSVQQSTPGSPEEQLPQESVPQENTMSGNAPQGNELQDRVPDGRAQIDPNNVNNA